MLNWICALDRTEGTDEKQYENMFLLAFHVAVRLCQTKTLQQPLSDLSALYYSSRSFSR